MQDKYQVEMHATRNRKFARLSFFLFLFCFYNISKMNQIMVSKHFDFFIQPKLKFTF